MFMNKTNRDAVIAKLTAARKRLASFVMRVSGATLDDTAIIRNERVVLSGSPLECAIVGMWANTVGIAGVTLAAPDADDPEWTFIEIPLSGVESALAAAARGEVVR